MFFFVEFNLTYSNYPNEHLIKEKRLLIKGELQEDMEEKFLTPEQAAEYLSVSVKTVRAWLRQGKIKGVKEGRLWRIPAEALQSVGQRSSPGVYTTWNQMVAALSQIGFFPGLVGGREDVPVRLVPLVTFDGQRVQGWLEVEMEGLKGEYGPCLFDALGYLRTLRDWIPDLPLELNREGIAVPEAILEFLPHKKGEDDNA